MINLKEDLSTLTTIDKSVFSKIESKIMWCISDAIEQAISNKEDCVNINLGYGILTIKFDNNSIKYKFKPSQKFEKLITDTVVNERNDLVLNIENSLVSKLNKVYKDLL